MTDNTGLSDWEYGSRENMIKGRIAETLIEELFLALDYNVFRYGMENTIPGIKESLRGMRSNVANSIRKMPDLVVQNGNCIYFIEVKYCGDGTFNYKRLIKESKLSCIN